jgi:hypothetical protein
MHRSPLLACLTALLTCGPAVAQDVDLEVVHRIKQEAFARSQVMDHLFYLSDANGPRLTNSPGYRRAAEWVVGRLKDWGLQDAALEPWGEFGRGWSLEHFEAHLLEPAYAPLHGVPLAWSGSTDGPQSGELLHAPLFQRWERDRLTPRKLGEVIDKYITRYRGKLKGRIVLLNPDRKFESPDEPDSVRHDGQSLGELADAPDPVPAPEYTWPDFEIPEDPEVLGRWFRRAPGPVRRAASRQATLAFARLWRFLGEEKAQAVLTTDRRGSGAVLFAEGIRPFWETDLPKPLPVVVLQPESYSRIVRLLEREVPVKVELDVRTRFHEEDLTGYNVVANIPGGAKKDEVVMLGGHLDSWHAGTGAADNAAGCAVALEAARILTALGLSLDRTVRLALWGGEEQAVDGSRGYVARHFGDPITMKLLPEHALLSGYFNLDNGSGKIRGVYLQGNDMMRPVFQGWLAPFADMGATTISIRNTGGTDHQSFDAVGLPGFQFIQEPLDYYSRTHHSDLDVYDHIVPEDLMQAAAVLATVVYHAANREERLPRKPLPKALAP